MAALSKEMLVVELEQDRSLDEPARLRERSDALYRLETCFPGSQAQGSQAQGAAAAPALDAALCDRAHAISARLAAVDRELFRSIRRDIRRGRGAARLGAWAAGGRPDDRAPEPVSGESYDYLDVLVSGVLQLEAPVTTAAELAPEMVPYQPTPARHIFDLVERAKLTKRDVLIDLGSGLGHVPMLVAVCTGARAVGIELQAAYVDVARRSAVALKLTRVAFIRQDARAADLSAGTVFYLFTPFVGSMLAAVLDALRREAAGRQIRVCTLGPCTPVVAEERWLESAGTLQTDRTVIFRSRA